ncbi:MAG: enoyl-CoA hydratase/isomerase family protein [Salinigranum sp.]
MTDANDEYDNLDLEYDGAVARVTLSSTSRFNSLNPLMVEELLDAVTAATAADGVRCLVLTAAGDAFCAGADLSALAGDATDRPRLRRLAGVLHDAVSHLYRAPVPVLVGVDGTAAGAGFGLSLCGDLVIAGENARFEYVYPRVGLTGDGGATWLLPRVVGLRRAREIALLDEPIGPEEALELGLVTEVADGGSFEARLSELAAEVASGPTRAYGATRQLFAESFDRGLEAQLAAEAEALAAATTTEDYERGYDAFFGGGDPEFVGR